MKSVRGESVKLFLCVGCLYLLTNSGFDTSEGLFHYQVARQIVTHHELGFAQPLPGIFTVAPNGRTYGSHEIGNTLLMLPVAALNSMIESLLGPRLGEARAQYIGGMLLAFMAALYCALAVTLLYVLCRSIFELPVREAGIGSLIFGFSTFFWTYSRNLFDGVLCSVLLMGGVLLLFTFQRTQHKSQLLLAFALFGFGVITRLSMVIPVLAGLGFVIASTSGNLAKKLQFLIIASLALIPFCLWQFYYNWLRTGNALLSPVQTAQYAANNALNGSLLAGVTGLLLSPGKSIFIYCPTALLSIFCFPAFRRRFPAQSIFIAMVAAGWLILHAKLISWFGAWGWGPRHFVTIAPLVSVPFIVGYRKLSDSTLFRKVAPVLLTWGLLLALCSVIGNWHYREGLDVAQGNISSDWIWSSSKNQAVDMLVGAYQNLSHILRHTAPTPALPLESPANYAASTTINVWWVTAWRHGIPGWMLVLSCATLVSISSLSGLALFGGRHRFAEVGARSRIAEAG